MPRLDAILAQDARIAVLIEVSRRCHVEVALSEHLGGDELAEENLYLVAILGRQDDVAVLDLGVVKSIRHHGGRPRR